MRRCHRNEGTQFADANGSLSRENRAVLLQRREAHSNAWDHLDRGWNDAMKEMAQAGIMRALPVNEGSMIKLNVGGSHVNVYPSVLKGVDSPSSSNLANIFSTAVWDHRVPTCEDGRVFLDESPTYVVHLIRTLLETSATGEPGTSPGTLLAADEIPYLSYVSSTLGMSELLPHIGMTINGGSTIFKSDEAIPRTATIQRWCTCDVGKPEEMKLLYRASRDGWNAQAFHTRCGDDSAPTVTLFRVAGDDGRDAVVGGYSSASWARYDDRAAPYCYQPSPGAFLFMLGDNYGSKSKDFRPVKWGIKEGHERYAVLCGRDYGPYFGQGDLTIRFDDISGTLRALPYSFDLPAGCAAVNLHEKPILEVEVFCLCSASAPTSPRPAKRAKTSEIGPPERDLEDISRIEEMGAEINDDVRRFGVAVADCLLEERLALIAAHSELDNAKRKAREAINALTAVYGPNAAEGRKDSVVELNVRGATMTTLRSTLQACPGSSLAMLFDEEKWPPTERDKDARGRRLVDCKPSAFAKVLDVLRMRKREAWAQPIGCKLVRVAIKPEDCEAFYEFVHMYFAGCEGFIVDCVDLA